MVKFSKQYEAQLVPEWKDAFVDYGQLKKDLKKIQLLNSNKNSSKQQKSVSFASSFISSLGKINLFSQKRCDHGTIQVHRKLASSISKGDMYETELLEQFVDVEGAGEFFSCLDTQLNKVNQFYRSKEKDFVEKGNSAKKQLDFLIEAKNNLKRKKDASSQDFSDDPSISSQLSSVELELTEETGQEQGQYSSTEEQDKSGSEISRSDELERSSRRIKRDESGSRSFSSRVFNCQGKNLTINIPLTTPSRTFSAISSLVWEDVIGHSSRKGNQRGIQINKTNLHHAEKMIRGAFIELYKGLSYLQTYRNLNMLAFVKILKKFDKVTNKEVLPIYLRVVENSYFNTSDMVMRLSDEVEELFVKHFAKDDKRKAMKYLKPNHRKESHAVTFFIGLFTGCFIALLAGYVIMAHLMGLYTKQSPDTVYMETVYPVLSMFSLLFLHIFLYGCNIFTWKKARINYSFILELAPTKELKYREVFLICTASMTAIIGVLFIHLSLAAKGYSSILVQAIPGLLLLSFLLLLFCPLNVVYKPTRYRFLRVIRNIVLSPLYKVVMLDFFMADQLCSQVPLLRNLEYVACYYITGSYKTQDFGYCVRTTHYRDLAYAVSFIPYYWRAMQCARRWFDEGQVTHLVNLGKYVSAMLAAGAKLAYEKEKTTGYLCLVVALSSGATVYQLYWDYVKDWGLLQFDSKNPWLRNELLLRKKFIYYFSMVLNLILRLAWLQTVLHPSFGNVDYRVIGLFLAALEVIRRGQWNFYRLENEHLNNAGKFRAVKQVPLPFHEVDEEE
ncbi:phosphate transporter PHO1 homolog 1 isoform X1 [Beta vulgaris subsp. vulgaris]|uniref:phosphate transporter PHO1 homolog 1 isoform X1 n=1 Tax=Beta vulgaris subsp. vulgaris TaxID=3555 RepID=UPI0020368E10|nr:phosphate transporter PHO1 homolog 1 isoform X1 [Beta vulgaris subsp. vulgaris]